MKKLMIIFLTLLCLLIWAAFIEPGWIETKQITLYSDKLSPDLPGIRIVQLSDLHLKNISKFEKKIIKKVNQLDADIIVFTGDMFYSFSYFEGRARKLEPVLKHAVDFVSALRSKNGIFLCRGNNDMSDQIENSNRYLQAMQEIGVQVLSNKADLLSLGGQKVYLAGVDFPEFSKGEAAEFKPAVLNENTFLQSGPSNDNSYSHYYTFEDSWQNYIFQGKILITDLKGGIGLTFYSHLHKGWDLFYRLRGSGEMPFNFSSHGVKLTGSRYEARVLPVPHTWYNFKINVETLFAETVMKAKIWPEYETEPIQWQMEAYDTSAFHIRSGTIGLWSHGKGEHAFDDLLVEGKNGDTLLCENFKAGLIPPSHWVDWNYADKAIPLLFQKAPPNVYSILLSHSPDYITTAEKYNVNLVLSGHTHGGQIRLPFFGAPLVRISLGRRYMQGLFQFENTLLYVNRGLGTITLPLRLLCRPEITVFDLRGGK
ncbi:metallophosphoesterase [candidate division KSB1 bacterium]|nr:metallophosphoesterase [candidate division KSB1 bacterium]